MHTPPFNSTLTHPFYTPSLNKGPKDDPFLACWRLQDCDPCLHSAQSRHCSWCPVSGTCVPNYAQVPLLAPIFREDICPLAWRERLELRTRPFGCRVSTFTFLTGLISIVATLAGVLLLWLSVRLAKWGRRRWAKREEGWWKVWKWRRRPRWLAKLRWASRHQKGGAEQVQPPEADDTDAEARPLLG